MVQITDSNKIIILYNMNTERKIRDKTLKVIPCATEARKSKTVRDTEAR